MGRSLVAPSYGSSGSRSSGGTHSSGRDSHSSSSGSRGYRVTLKNIIVWATATLVLWQRRQRQIRSRNCYSGCSERVGAAAGGALVAVDAISTVMAVVVYSQ